MCCSPLTSNLFFTNLLLSSNGLWDLWSLEVKPCRLIRVPLEAIAVGRQLLPLWSFFIFRWAAHVEVTSGFTSRTLRCNERINVLFASRVCWTEVHVWEGFSSLKLMVLIVDQLASVDRNLFFHNLFCFLL